MWASLVCVATDDGDLEHVAMLSSVPSQENTKPNTRCESGARTLLGNLKRNEITKKTLVNKSFDLARAVLVLSHMM